MECLNRNSGFVVGSSSIILLQCRETLGYTTTKTVCDAS